MPLAPAHRPTPLRQLPTLYAVSIAMVSCGATAMMILAAMGGSAGVPLSATLYGVFILATFVATAGVLLVAHAAPHSPRHLDISRLLNVTSFGLGLAGLIVAVGIIMDTELRMTSLDWHAGTCASMLLVAAGACGELVRRHSVARRFSVGTIVNG